MICSLHNHCTLCDGKSDLSEMVRAAEEAGITDFGISCHAPVPDDTDARVESEESYIAAVREFMSSYRGKMNLYLGIEEDALMPVKRRSEYDYIIGSNHYFEGKDRLYTVDVSKEELAAAVDEIFGGDFSAAAREYYARVVKEAKNVDIIGHFDLIRLYGAEIAQLDGSYRDIAISALDECLATGAAFELNFGAVTKGKAAFPYPDDFLLRRIRSKGGRVIVSTDCHDARLIAAGLCEGERLLAAYGFTEVTVLSKGGFTSRKIAL